MEVPNVRVCDLLALSEDLQREMVEQIYIQNKVPAIGIALLTMPKALVEFIILL